MTADDPRSAYRPPACSCPLRPAAPHRRPIAVIALLTLLLGAPALRSEAGPAPSPPPAPTPTVEHPLEIAEARFNYRVPEARQAIEVDGRLDEPAWQRALALELGYETQPAENRPPPVRTVALVTYDRDRLYVGFRAYDPRPDEIRARYSDRDTAWEDDLVGFKIDTFNDERQAYEFFVNPLGIQHDIRSDDISRSEDTTWDAIWDAAARLTEEGYMAELAIPFSSLRFPAGANEMTWGFGAIRFYPRGQRHRISLEPIDRDRSCQICQISKITGLSGVTPGRNLEITPTLTAGRTDSRENFPDGELIEGDTDSDAGLTVSWGITPNMTLSGTLNPDFSQVEADSARLNINEQFALFFPERRPFFLEGGDIFNTPVDAVFTRNVADPAWGAKLVGKQGDNGLGLFVAQDEVTNLLLPGSQGSDTATLDDETVDSALRYRRDIGESSSLGFLATSREGSRYHNRVVGLDGLYRFTDSDSVSMQFLSSDTRYPEELALDREQPSGSFSDTALRLGYDHQSRNWRGYVRYDDFGENVRLDMGFQPRVDFKILLGGLERIWWGDEDDRWTRVTVGGDWDLTEDQSGQLLEREVEMWSSIKGPRQSHFSVSGGTRDRTFQGIRFDDEVFGGVYGEIRPSANLFTALWVGFGDAIDFANVRPADQLTVEPRLNVRLGRHFSLNLNHLYRSLDVEGGRLFTANLSQARAVYQLNPRTLFRVVLQHTDIARDPNLYLDEVEAETQDLFSQLLFSYKLNARTVIFAGYSDGRAASENTGLTIEDRSFFLKLGYAWVV